MPRYNQRDPTNAIQAQDEGGFDGIVNTVAPYGICLKVTVKKFTVKPRFTSRSVAVLGGSDEQETGWLYAGRLAETGALVDAHFDTARPHVVAIFGKLGSGKSYDAGELLRVSMKPAASALQRDTAVLLLDTLGIFEWTEHRAPLKDGACTVRTTSAQAQRRWNLKPEALDVQVWVPKSTRGDAGHPCDFAVRVDFNGPGAIFSTWTYTRIA